MNNSFIFYKSFFEAIEIIPDDSEKWQLLKTLCSLAFEDKEADLNTLTDNQKIIYLVASEQIKASIRNRNNGLKGGRPSKTPVKTPLLTNVNVNVNKNDNENENENVNTLTHSQTTYSKTIFNIFKNAHLPCSNEKETSFLMRDFYNAIGYIHRQPDLKNIHSDDIIKACENYAKVFSDEKYYYKVKMDFYTLVQSKQFWKFLPGNFSEDTWIKYNSNFGANDNGAAENIHEEQYEICPKCRQKKLFWSNEKQKFFCDACNVSLTWDEKEGGQNAS